MTEYGKQNLSISFLAICNFMLTLAYKMVFKLVLELIVSYATKISS